MIHHGFIHRDVYYGMGWVNSDTGFSCSRSTPHFSSMEKTHTSQEISHFYYQHTITVLTGQQTSEEATVPNHRVKPNLSGLTLWLGAVAGNCSKSGQCLVWSQIRLKLLTYSVTSCKISPQAQLTVKHRGTKCMNSSTEEKNPNLGPSKLV